VESERQADASVRVEGEGSVGFLIYIIQLASTILTVLIIIDVVLTYFLSPFHPLRQALDQLVEPMLAPIRRIVPTVGMIDFSPVVLLIVIQLVESLVIGLLRSL
jgi:YggT family protein